MVSTNERRITVNEFEAGAHDVPQLSQAWQPQPRTMADLRKQGIVTRFDTLKTGETVGGGAFRSPAGRSPTCCRNRFYIGEVPFKVTFHGEQPRIRSDLFDAVQAKLSEQTTNHRTTRMNSEALLNRPHSMTAATA